MSSVLAEATGRLDDTSLRTFFYEAMSIVNSRPLTTDLINDPKSLEPLTPNHLLTMKSSVPLPPPGNFVKEDLYTRKRWRKVQYLAEQFWSRWRQEYLVNIRLRQQWRTPRKNMQVGDVVIVKDDNSPRNEWKLARIIETYKDDDGLVRKVMVQMGQSNLGNKGERLTQPSILERPISFKSIFSYKYLFTPIIYIFSSDSIYTYLYLGIFWAAAEGSNVTTFHYAS